MRNGVVWIGREARRRMTMRNLGGVGGEEGRKEEGGLEMEGKLPVKTAAEEAWNEVEGYIRNSERPPPFRVRQLLHALRQHPDPTLSLRAARVMEALGSPLSSQEIIQLVEFLLLRKRPLQALYAIQEMSLTVPLQLKNLILSELLKRNYVSEAKTLFQNLDEPDLYSYTIFAHELTRLGDTQTAKEVLWSMQKANIEPDSAAWRTILFVLGRDGQDQAAINLLLKLEERGWNLGSEAYTTVMANISNGRSRPFEAVERLRDRIRERKIPWTKTMMNAWNRAHNYTASMTVRARIDSNRFDRFAAHRMIVAAARESSSMEALRLFDRMRNKNNYHFGWFTYGYLLRVLMREGYNTEAVRLADTLLGKPVPDSTVMVMIRVFDSAGRDEDVERIFKMNREDRRPTQPVYGAMIQFYLHRRRTIEAMALMEEMQESGVPLRDVHWNMFVHSAKDDEEAWKWIDRMKDAGYRPNRSTLTHLIRIAVRKENDTSLDRILAFAEEIRNDSADAHIKNEDADSAAVNGSHDEIVDEVISTLGRAKRFDDAIRVARQRKGKASIRPSTVTALILSAIESDDVDAVESIARLAMHLKLPWVPSSRVLHSICRLEAAMPNITAFLLHLDRKFFTAVHLETIASTTGDLSVAEDAFQECLRQEWTPSHRFYRRMLRLYATSNDRVRTEAIVEEACKIHGVSLDFVRELVRHHVRDRSLHESKLCVVQKVLDKLQKGGVVVKPVEADQLFVQLASECSGEDHTRDVELSEGRRTLWKEWSSEQFHQCAERLKQRMIRESKSS